MAGEAKQICHVYCEGSLSCAFLKPCSADRGITIREYCVALDAMASACCSRGRNVGVGSLAILRFVLPPKAIRFFVKIHLLSDLLLLSFAYFAQWVRPKVNISPFEALDQSHETI